MSEHTIAEEEDQEEVQEKVVVGSNEPSIGHGERAKSVAVEVEQEQTSLMFPGQKVIKGFSDGTHYEGEWKFGRAHGTGTVKFGKAGSLHCPPYRGFARQHEMKQDAQDIQPPRSTATQYKLPKDGDRYAGEWRRGLPNGKGVMRYANGDEFRGRFESGRRTGKGEYVWANGIEKHVGYWNRLEEGKGIRVYESSDVYRGDFMMGARWGLGVTTSKDGSFHSGQYRAGKAHGEGQEHSTQTDMWYEGEYVGGLRHGRGSLSTPLMEFEGEWAFDSKDGAGTMKKKNGSVFRGYFKMDQALGGGELLFADGNSYQGEFMNGVADGKGEFRWLKGVNRGDIYQGEFMAGHRHGRGRLLFANGNRVEGEFRWNKFCGQMTFQSLSGVVQEQIWHVGRPGYVVRDEESIPYTTGTFEQHEVIVGSPTGRLMKEYLFTIITWRPERTKVRYDDDECAMIVLDNNDYRISTARNQPTGKNVVPQQQIIKTWLIPAVVPWVLDILYLTGFR